VYVSFVPKNYLSIDAGIVTERPAKKIKRALEDVP